MRDGEVLGVKRMRGNDLRGSERQWGESGWWGEAGEVGEINVRVEG